MSRIELAAQIGEDFDRILEHLQKHVVEGAAVRIDEILQGISVLETNPLIGRPAENGLRELVIGRRAKGYLALYRFIPEIDLVLVLAIRGRKKAGYRQP